MGKACHMKLLTIHFLLLIQYLGFQPKICAKNASKFKQNFGVQTLRLGTEKSRVESKCTLHSILQERKVPSEAEMHSADRLLIKMRKATYCLARLTS